MDFHYDLLRAPPLFSLLPYTFDDYVSRYIMTPRFKVPERIKILDQAMRDYGFEFFAAGTNRRAYRHLMSDDFLVKIAIDRAGMQDAPAEWRNAKKLKPFCTKIFECSPSGCMGLYERVQPIIYKDQFISVAEDVFDLLTRFVIGRYVLADIGSNYFMNYGLRKYFGPVLLDYTYMYELDGAKLYCKEPMKTPYGFIPCGGLIDYDDGFNHLYCQKCGKRYFASELENKIKKQELDIIGGRRSMGIKIYKNGQLWKDTTSQNIDFKEAEAISYDPNKGKIHNRSRQEQQPQQQVPVNDNVVQKNPFKGEQQQSQAAQFRKRIPNNVPKYEAPQQTAQKNPVISEDVKTAQRSFLPNDVDGTETIITTMKDVAQMLYNYIPNIDVVRNFINAMNTFSFMTRHVKSKDFLTNILDQKVHPMLVELEKEARAKAISDAVVANVLARQQAESVMEYAPVEEQPQTAVENDHEEAMEEQEEYQEEEEILTPEDLRDIEEAHEEEREQLEAEEEEKEEELTPEQIQELRKAEFLKSVDQNDLVSEEQLRKEAIEQMANTELPPNTHGQLNLSDNIKLKY